MMNLAINDHRLARPGTENAALRDYDSVRRAIAFISEHWRAQPTIEAVADAAAVTPDELHHLFRRWAGLAFADPGEEPAALADMQRRWPRANYVEDVEGTSALARRIFDSKLWRPDQPLRVVLIGTDFEVRVWETLLKIPMGRAVCYSDIANKIKNPKASRAVGAAIGRNPVSFVVPCHRALGKGGALTGYHWGVTRKQAMLGWEAGQVGLH